MDYRLVRLAAELQQRHSAASCHQAELPRHRCADYQETKRSRSQGPSRISCLRARATLVHTEVDLRASKAPKTSQHGETTLTSTLQQTRAAAIGMTDTAPQ